MKQNALIIFRNGDSYFTEIDPLQTSETLGQRMCGGGFLICQDDRWGKSRELIVNLADISCICRDVGEQPLAQ
jgi:hypothetical protein